MSLPNDTSFFSTKAQTLEKLQPRLKCSTILDQVRVTVSQWQTDDEACCNDVLAKSWSSLVVRSSATHEDEAGQSQAGAYCSVLNVEPNVGALREAVERVIASFGENPAAEDEVFIQPMLENVELAGVVFTADLDTWAPYYTINYDASGGTDTVTSGRAENTKTYVRFRDAISPAPDPLQRLVDACKEVEEATQCAYLDIEFAVVRGEVIILQVRPLAPSNEKVGIEVNALNDALVKVSAKIEKLSRPHPRVLGGRQIFGVMPDWNPAEMIGLRPRQLASSLYKEMITDNIWAYQRDNYGYRNLRSHPLIKLLLGVPYIDVRVSFNSFIPKSLHESIASKLVDYYLDALAGEPHLHDKIEFEVVHSCAYLNLKERLAGLREVGFIEAELEDLHESLRILTNRILDPVWGLYKTDLEKIESLSARFEEIERSDLSMVDKVYWHLEDCKRYGTLPFAGIARAAFVSVQILRSMVELDIIDDAQRADFLRSLVTGPLGILAKGFAKCAREKRAKRTFCKHLVTFVPELTTSYRLDTMRRFDNYFGDHAGEDDEPAKFEFSSAQHQALNSALHDAGLELDSRALLACMRETIEGRERAKFVFTRSISRVLQLVEEFGARFGFSKDDLSFLDIGTMLKLYANLDERDIPRTFRENIERHKHAYHYTEAVKLPAVILAPTDVYAFTMEEGRPNFVTRTRIEAVPVDATDADDAALKGAIGFIPSADPGYDYLFTKGIAGLVTQYGGANSHMAIRCAELGLPAVIGAGEKNFVEWGRAKRLLLDCAGQQVRVLA